MRHVRVLAVLPLLLLAACSADPKPAAAPAATPSAAGTAAATVVAPTDLQGSTVCRMVAAAIDDDTVMDDGVVKDISDAASRSTTESIRYAGAMLSDRYDLAKAGGGTAAELDVTTAAIDMQTACVTAGLASK